MSGSSRVNSTLRALAVFLPAAVALLAVLRPSGAARIDHPASEAERLFPKEGAGRPVMSFDIAGSRTESAIFDLSQGDSGSLRARLGERGWWILDASKGIAPGQAAFVNENFGLVHEKLPAEATRVCWRRTPAFPLVSGLCQPRSVGRVLDPSPSDLARTPDGFATVTLKRTGETNLVLITHSHEDWHAGGAPSAMREEVCLAGLARGQACAMVELLPGASLFALSLVSRDPVNRKSLEEFNLAHGSTALDALAEFKVWAVPAEDRREFEPWAKWCPGLIDGSKLEIARPSWLTGELSHASSHAILLRSLQRFTDHVVCPGIFEVELPALGLNEPLAGARTLLRSLRDESVWLTTPASYSYRSEHTARAALAFDSERKAAWVLTPHPIEQLSVSFMFPDKFPEELLADVAAGGARGKWRVNSVGARAFRVSFDRLEHLSWVDLSEFTQLLNEPRLKWRTVRASAGFRLALTISFVLAMIFGLLQTASPSRGIARSWTLTALAVFAICFVIVFASFHNARKIAGGEASIASLEFPAAPLHFFLRELPDHRMGDVADSQAAAEKQSRLTLVRGPRWFEFRPAASPRPVYVWEDIRARNFYFRRSPEYAASLVGWRRLAASAHDGWAVREGPDLDIAGLPENAILVAPDLAFVSQLELEALDGFVARGGILVFSFGAADDASLIDGKRLEGPFADVLRSAGLGTGQVTFYSEVSDPGFNFQALTTRHLLSESQWVNGRRYHAGSVVFLGVQPLDSTVQTLVAHVIHRLQGGKLAVRDVGEGCATALLVKPFASFERLSKFADEVKALGFDVRWFVDPNAFPNLVPKWGARFLKDGVAFMDDGTGKGRFTAQKNWTAFLLKHRAGERPLVLATERRPLPGLYQGPELELIGSKSFDLESLDQRRMVRSWLAECGTGLAAPRVIADGRSTSLDSFVGILRTSEFPQLKPRGLETYLRRSLLAETSSTLKVLGFREDQPNLFKVGTH